MNDRTLAPLSAEQERMWLLVRLHGAVPALHERGGAWLDGQVEVERLRRALEVVAARHEVLRTTVEERGGQPTQVIAPVATPALRVLELDARGASISDERALAVAAEEVCAPFDLQRGPLLRTALIRVHARRHLLVVTMHHIISDGDASVDLLLAELFAAYHAAELPPLSVQYQDYARTQAEPGFEAVARRQLERWRIELAGARTTLALATDRPRPAAQTFAGGREELRFADSLCARLYAFASGLDTDLYTVLLAALQVVLHRHSHQDDVLVGAPLPGRADPRLRGLLGYFGNPVVVRGRFAGDPSFRAVVRQIHQAVLEARSHGEVSFKKVVEALAPWRDPGRAPLFQVLFHVRAARRDPLVGDRLTLTPVDVELPYVAYDLIVTAQPTSDGGLTARVEYNRDLFDADTAARLLEHWEVLIMGAVMDPDAPVSRLPLMREAEVNRVIHGFNADARSFAAAPQETLHARFSAHARRGPDAPAVRYEGEALCYGELERRSNQLAHLLRRLGVGRGALVGICMDRSVEMIVAMLGVLKAGGAYVPFDPAHPTRRLEYMLGDAGIAVLLAKRAFLDWLADGRVTVVRLDEDWPRIAEEPTHEPEPRPGEGPEELAYVMYTSGSTGRPKGAGIPHRCIVSLVVDTDYMRVEVKDRVAQTANASFDAATMEIWGALLNGAEIVGVSRDVALAPERLARDIRELLITVMVLTPALFAQVAREVPGAFAPLTTLVIGGDALDPEAVRRVLAAGPPANLINGYGPTETTTCATWFRVSEPPASGATIPIGRPVARASAYILDPRQEPVPIGEIGEIYVGGDGVGHGYWRRPELTTERFPHDPFAGRAGARMYRTGDLGRYRSDGTIEFFGRVDHQLKIRGFRIELGEVEAALAELPDVKQAVAVADTRGQRLLAYVVPDRAAICTTDDALVRGLRAALAVRLPEYEVPSAFLLLDALPLTPNGKVDRAALPAIDERRGATGQEFVAPRSEVEELLADIWKELLGLPRVGVHDNFFELGGHSLHAVRLFSRLRAVCGLELRFQTFFNHATIAALAGLMRRERGAPGGGAAISRAPRGGPLALSFGQERLWFINKLAPDSRAYNCLYPYRWRGALDVRALDQALRALVMRHEVLRTTYAEVDGQPVQIINSQSSARLTVVDLQHLADEEREAEVQERLADESQRRFDLERGPLLCAGLVRLAADEHVLWLHFHHMTMDGWSTELAFRELGELYAALARGRAPALPELALHYADFAAWQRGDLIDDAEATAELLRFWERTLHGAPPLLDLPGDRPRPPVQSFAGAAVTFTLDAALTRSLRELGARQGMTLTMVLLAGYAALLHRYTRSDDIVVGMPSANRDRVELERIMGFFVNTLPMRIDVAGDPTFATLLGRVRAVCLAAYDHDALPFERLVHALRLPRDPSYNPGVQVAFAPQPPAGRDLQLLGLVGERLEVDARKAIFELSFYSWDSAGGVAGIFEYSTDRFERATIERMTVHLRSLLAAAAADPERLVSALPMIGDDERRTLLEWGNGPASAASAETVVDRFEAQVERDPDAVAVASDDEAMTYGALDRRANQLAHLLRELGVEAGDRVAVCVGRSPALVVSLLAILKVSGVYAPFDPEGSAERLATMLGGLGAEVLIAGPGAARELPGFTGRVIRLDDGWTALAGRSESRLARASEADALAYVVHTSGSTGRPKGVLLGHRGLNNLVAWHVRTFKISPLDRATLVASPGFDASVWEIWPYLCTGARLVVPAAALRVSPEELQAWMMRHGITISFQSTAIAEALVRLDWPERCDLRVLLTGGDRLRATPGARVPFVLVNNYGPTEATVVTTSGVVELLSIDDGVRGDPSIGRPIDGVIVRVLDGRGELVPVGVPGELYIGGVGLARGYLGGAEVARFVVGEDGQRLYRSGDLVRWSADGTLEFLGRTDEQIKIRGFRIEPGEIEAVLQEHPAVRDAVVLAVAEDVQARRLVAYFTVAEDADAAVELRGEHVAAWRGLYDETYAKAGGDAQLNIVGWNSSYDGQAIAAGAMRAWRDRTVERIAGFGARRVWEIGCGTGLLLLQLAPGCAKYVGTDFSEQALATIRPALGALPQVALERREANDFDGVAPRSFDAVVLNSIVQYFPDAAYLRAVIAGAVRSAGDGGVVFVGDVRSLPLLAAFHASIELSRAGSETSLAELRARVRRAAECEEELLIAPEFFVGLCDELPRVEHAEVWLRRGRGDDEMTRYRCDAVLFVGDAPEPVTSDEALAWSEVGALDVLAERLAAVRGAVELLGVPNARVIADVRAAEALRGSGDGAAGDVRAAAQGIEPEALWDLGERLGLAVRVTYSRERGPGFMDALFEAGAVAGRPRAWIRARSERRAEALVREPLRSRRAEDLVPRLRAHLAARLPEYMIPAAFVRLDALPRTTSGKLDRRALPLPEVRREAVTEPVRVGSEVEAVLLEIWRKLLGVEEIAVDRPFFELGGHSLLLARVRAAISKRLGVDVPIVELFQHPTIRGLTAHIHARTGVNPVVPVTAARSVASADGVAIVGMAGRFPRAADIDELWRNLVDSVEGLTVFDDGELREMGVEPLAGLVPACGVLADTYAFDAAFFGYSRADAELMDPQQRVFLECAWAAIEHAGYDPLAVPGSVGVFAGSDAPNYWMERVGFRGGPLASEAYRTASANMTDGLTMRVAYKLGLRGPAVTVLSACSTSLVAVHLACRSLLSGESDMVLAGGVAIHPESRVGHVYEEGSVVSPDGHCRPFDADARGTVNGNGVGVVLLKRLADAAADGDTIHAVIRGSAVLNDGARKVGYTAPGVDGQAETIARAHAVAGVEPDSISYVEAHGTGTRLGDPVEVAALTQVFRRRTARVGFCALGSIKGNVGHLGAAAGVAGLIKAAMSLEREVLAPTLHFRRANPELALATSPFFVSAEPIAWPRGREPRRAGVSAFGVGGTNAHVVLEEAPEEARSEVSRGSRLIVLSARTPAALAASAARLAGYLRGTPGDDLADVAYTLQRGRTPFNYRRSVVATSAAEAAELLSTRDDGVGVSDARVVFMFPGGGTQELDMGKELYAREPVYRAWVDRCAGLFAALGVEIEGLLFPAVHARAAAAERSLRTRENLALIFSTEVALAELLMAWGIRPAAVTGHSLGEYAAAYVAGVLSLADAVALIVARSELYEMLPADAGTIIVRSSEAALVGRLSADLSLAAVNGPDVCVVSGAGESLRRLEAELLRDGVELKRLAVATAAHSVLIEPLAGRLTARAASMTRSPPRIPMISNVTGGWLRDDDAVDPSYWARHLSGTVRFADGLGTLLADPRHVLLEVGPGASLARTAARQTRGERLVMTTMAGPEQGRRDVEALLTAVGRLWCAGVVIDWAALTPGARRRVPLPTYPFARTRHVFAGGRAEGPTLLDLQEVVTESREGPATLLHDGVEREIAEIWGQSLGLARIGRDEDFFALGGDSLLAVGVIARLRARFAADLDAHALLESPTIAGLGERIRGGATRVPDGLVQLHAGDPRQPLFLVHPVGGHVYCFEALVRELRLERSVCALRSPGIEDLRAHPGSVEALAREYVRCIRAVQPEGPYIIGGYSFGGAVAVEMAAQLVAAGQEVRTPILLDSPAPTGFRGIDVEARAFEVFVAEQVDAGDAALLVGLPPDERLPRLRELLRARGRGVEVEQLAHLLAVLTTNLRAWVSHVPRAWPGELLLARARDNAAVGELGEELGWGQHAAGVEVALVPGDHHTFLRGENVRTLAAVLRGRLA